MRPFALVITAALIGLSAAPAAANFSSCVAGLRSAAIEQGVSAAVFDRAMSGVQPDMDVIKAMNNQPEFRTPIWDYLGALVDEERVAEGRALLSRHAATLAAAESRFGVDRHTIVAVWGVESNYGQVKGKWSLPQALSTAACLGGRRQAFFRGELFATMKIIQRGDLEQSQLVGSWAGAFGHTQFIPTTYLRLAVDGDGDGRRDLVSSIPDALHSTANFMAKAGWQTGASWGYEVRVPQGYSGPVGARRARRFRPGQRAASPASTDPRSPAPAMPGSSIRRRGPRVPGLPQLRRRLQLQWRGQLCARDLAPFRPAARAAGRAAALADRRSADFAGGAPRAAASADRAGPRRRRARRAVGAKTRAAIMAEEARFGLPQTGRPGGKILRALRGR